MFALKHIGNNQQHPFIQHFLKPPFASWTALSFLLQCLMRLETIPSSRITPAPLDSQLHVGASLQFTPLVFLQGSGQRIWMVIAEAWFCAQWPIFVLFLRFLFGLLYGWKIQTWPIIRFLTESVILLIFLSVGIWYNSWCHVFKQDFQDLQQKYRPTTSKIQQYISLYTLGTFYPCVHQTHLECLLLKS